MQLTGTNVIMGLDEGQYDGHAHVFNANLPMIAARRYTPNYNASVESLSDHLRANGLDGALLVQPSFLGTDNSFLVQTLEETRDQPDLQFRGVVALTEGVTDAEIDRFDEAGCVGFRLNLIGVSDEFDLSQWIEVLKKIDKRGWHIELHCECQRLPEFLPTLLRYCNAVVVDHFGLVGHDISSNNVGLATLLNSPIDRLFVKTSAPYRAFPHMSVEHKVVLSNEIFGQLLHNLGPSRLIWGSDWPWTQFENQHTYTETLSWRNHWISVRNLGR